MEPKHTKSFLLTVFFLLALCLVDYQGAAADNSMIQIFSTCNGSIAECDQEGEFLMESDISKRILAQQTHISYGALKKDAPACDSKARGESYRSCYPDPSNPYTRGCSKIYKCGRD